MTSIPRQCYRRLGFRGRFLLLVGIAYLAQGAASLDEWGLAPHDLAPGWVRALLWAAAGAVAIGTAWRPVHSTNPIGWVALYIPPAAWSASYSISFIAYLAPTLGFPFAYSGGLNYALVWLLVVAAVMVCSDWPEPPTEPNPPRADGGSS